MYVNGKVKPIKTILGMEGRREKENDGGDKFNYGIL
jgi:hypothetical protein